MLPVTFFSIKNMNNNKEQQFQLDLTQELAKGVYSNFAIISHSHAEFIVDFATTLPGNPKPQVVSRVVLAPEHAKRVAMALQENVMRYEQEHGRIDLGTPKPQGPATPPRTANPFGSSHGEA